MKSPHTTDRDCDIFYQDFSIVHKILSALGSPKDSIYIIRIAYRELTQIAKFKKMCNISRWFSVLLEIISSGRKTGFIRNKFALLILYRILLETVSFPED